MNSLPTIPQEFQKHMEQMFTYVLPITVRGVTQIMETTQNGEVMIHVRQGGLTVEVKQIIGEIRHESLKV